ncbi:RICIN domain-containing protein [Microdochium nivale]|nr:RICIN domain-containing protein [Microdochium nivale]
MPQLQDGTVISLINYGAGTALDLTASNPKNGTPVIGYNYNGTSNQHWKLVKVPYSGSKVWPTWFLINQATGTALDLLDGGQENGTEIVGWTNGAASKTNPHQLWRLITADTNFDVVAIQNVGTNTFVDLYNGGTENSTKVVGWAGDVSNQNPHQLWKVQIVS